MAALFEKAGLDYTVSVLVKSVTQDLSGIKLDDYNALVLYNPYDLKSLRSAFPDFDLGKLALVSYGRGIATALKNEGLTPVVEGPTPEIQSAAKAIDVFLSSK